MAVAHDITQKKRTCDVQISENVEFSGLLLSDSVLQGLKSCGFIRPSPIQLKAIPLGRCGLDLIVQAKSGTGKTCVFTVVALENIKLESSALQAVVLAPTREIAVQIWDVVTGIGKAMAGLECHTFIGGLPLQEDKAKLRKCHIAIGTPGRIKQLIELEVMKTKNVRMLILDEADKLLEADFQQQINWIYSTLPENKQMLALSATYPEYLAEHLTKYMRNPTFLRLNITDPALLGVKQYYLLVQYHPLPNNSFHIKSEAVVRLLSSMAFQQCLIFSNLQNRANNLAMELKSQGWPTACIAGSLDQTKRLAAMDELRSYQCRILISTDLTSRGIDADKVDLIIHLDVPKEHETYLHRTGRAGRYGSFGASVVIVSAGEEKRELEAVERKYNTRILPLPDPIPMDFTQQELSADLNQMVTSESILTCPASAVQPDGAVTACSPSHSSAGAAASSSGSLSGTLHQQPRENSSSVKTPQSLAQAETVPASTSEAESKLKSREENSSLEPVAIINGHVKSREENSSLEPVAIINGHVKGPCGGEDAIESRATASRNEISLQDSAVQLANEPKQKSKTDCCNSNKGTASAESTSQTGGASGESRVSATLTGKDAFPATAEMPSAGNRGDTLCAFDKVPQASCCLGSEGGKHQDLSMSSVCSRLKLVAEGPSTRADVDGDLSPSEKVDNGDSPIGSSCRTNEQSEDFSVQEGKRLLDDLTKQAPFLPENAISSSLQEVSPKTGSVPAPNIFSVPSKKSVVTFSVSAFSYSGSGAQSQFSFTKSFPRHLSLAISPPAPCVSNSGRSDSSKRKRTQNPGDDFWDDRSSNDFSTQNTREQPDSKAEEQETIAHTSAMKARKAEEQETIAHTSAMKARKAKEQETIAHTSAMKARKAKKPARRRLKDCMPYGEIGSAKQPAHEKLLEQQPVTTHDKNDLPTTHTKRPGLHVSSPENVVGTLQRSEDIDDTWGNKPRSVVSRNRSLVIYDEDWFDSPSSQNSSKEIVDPENSKAAVPVRNSSVVVEKLKGEIEMKENSSVTSSSSQRDSVSSDKERLALNTAAEKTGDKMALSGGNSDREGNGTAASSAGLQSQLATVPDDGQVWIEPPSVKPPPRRQLVTYNDDWLDPCEDTAKYESFGSASLKPAGRNRKKSKSKKHRNKEKKGESQNKQEPSVTVQQVDTTETASVGGADPDKQSKRINGSVVTVPQMDAGSGAYRPPLSQQEVKLEPVVRQKLHEVLFAPVAPAAFPPEETEISLQKTAGELKVKVMDDGSVQLGESPAATGTQLPDGTAEKAAAMSMLVGGESKLLDSIGSYKCKPDWVTSELEKAVSKILDSTYGTIQRQCRHLRGEKVVESKAERKSEDVEAVPVSRFDQSNSSGVKAQTENVDVSTVHVESPSVKVESATRSKSVPSTSIGEDHLRLRVSTHTKDSSETTLSSVSENHSLAVTTVTFKDSKISLNKVGNDSKSTQPLHVSAGLGIGVEDGGENVKEHQRARTCAGNVAQVARIHEVEKNPPTSALQSTCMSELEESSQSMPSTSGHFPVVTHSESATQSQSTNVKKKVKSSRSNFLLTPFLSRLLKEGNRETASEASMNFMKSLLQKQQGPEPKPAAQAVEQPPQVARNVKSGRQGARNSRIKKLDKKPRREAEPYSVDSDSDSNSESSSTSSSSSSSSLSWGHHIRNSHFSESILPQDRTAKSVRTGRVAKGQVTGVSHDDSHWVDTAGSQAWDRSNQRRTDLKKSRKAPQNGHSSEGFAKQRCQKNGFESSLPRNGRHSAWKGNESSVAKAHQEKESSYSGRGAWYEPGNESTPHHGYQYEDYSYQDSGQYLQSAADYYNYWDNGNNSSSYQAYNQSRLFEHVEDGYQGAEDTWGYSGWGGGDSQMYSGHEDTAQAQEGVSQGWWGPGTGTYSDHGFHQQDWHSQGWDHTGNGCQDYGNDWVQEVQGDPVAWYLHKALQARLRETRQQRHQQSLRKEMDYQSEYIAMMVKGAKNGFRK